MRILIAEDDAASRHLLEKFLAKWGYDVLVAKQGDEAWQLLQRQDAPRLAILDWMMPGMDGVEVCREARKSLPASPPYILLLTTRDQPQDLMEAFEAGADDYLTKPFDPLELKARLHAGGRLLEIQEQLAAARQHLERESTRDAVTGLWNRAAIVDMLRRELARAQRANSSLGVEFAELDQFEALTRTQGEPAANAVLHEVARKLSEAVRYYDSVGRYAGGKLLLIVPECNPRGALAQAHRLCALIGQKPLDGPGGSFSATLSLGVAVKSEAREEDADSLLRAAQEALERAQARGGNCAEAAPLEEPQGEPG